MLKNTMLQVRNLLNDKRIERGGPGDVLQEGEAIFKDRIVGATERLIGIRQSIEFNNESPVAGTDAHGLVPYSEIVTNLARWVNNLMYGTGRENREADCLEESRESIAKLAQEYEAAVGLITDHVGPGRRAVFCVLGHTIPATIETVSELPHRNDCFVADMKPLVRSNDNLLPVYLMGRCTLMHLLAQRVSESTINEVESVPDLESCWTDFLREIRVKLPVMLERATRRLGKKSAREDGDEIVGVDQSTKEASSNRKATRLFPVERFRNWLKMWFVLEVLDAPTLALDKQTRGDSHGWSMRADWAYVLREAVRFEEHERWRERRVWSRESSFDLEWDYLVQPYSAMDALRALVHLHITDVTKLAHGLDINAMLRELGEIQNVESYLLRTSLLQHMLEMYILGQFVLNMRLDWTGDKRQTLASISNGPAIGQMYLPETTAEALSTHTGMRPGNKSVRRIVQSYALAALYHDIGLVFVPRLELPGAAMVRGDTDVKTAVAATKEFLGDTSMAMLDRCVEELESFGFADTMPGGRLGRWIERQRSERQIHHTLVSAWYLSRTSKDLKQVDSAVIEDSIRAILSLGAVSEKINTSRSPVSSLLAVCDELCDWDPALSVPPDRHATVQKSRGAAASLTPYRTRIRAIGLQGMSFELEFDEHDTPCGVSASIPAKRPSTLTAHGGSTTDDSWPTILLSLESPEYLGSATFLCWLLVSRNIMRISPSFLGWAPTFHIRNTIPTRVVPFGGSARLLKQVLHRSRIPIRGHLEALLVRKGDASVQFEPGIVDEKVASESVTIRPIGKPIAPSDVREHLHELRREAYDLIQQEELRRFRKADE